MLEKLKEIIADQLNVDAATITPESRFKEDLEADSLDLFELVMYLDAAAQGGKTIKYKIRCVCKNGTAIETAEIELNL